VQARSYACSTARAHEDEERRAENLHAALVTRELIGQALGILIERERSAPTRPSTSCARPRSTSTSSSRGGRDLVDNRERPRYGSPRPVVPDEGSENGHQLAVVASLSQSKGPKALPNRGRVAGIPNRRTSALAPFRLPRFPRQATGGRAPSITVGAGHSALEPLLKCEQRVVRGTAAHRLSRLRSKGEALQTAPLPSAATVCPCQNVSRPEPERDVQPRAGQRADEQPKNTGLHRVACRLKPEARALRTWSSGSSTVIEETDEAERQLIMDERVLPAQLILARQWKQRSAARPPQVPPWRDVPFCSSDGGAGGLP